MGHPRNRLSILKPFFLYISYCFSVRLLLPCLSINSQAPHEALSHDTRNRFMAIWRNSNSIRLPTYPIWIPAKTITNGQFMRRLRLRLTGHRIWPYVSESKTCKQKELRKNNHIISDNSDEPIVSSMSYFARLLSRYHKKALLWQCLDFVATLLGKIMRSATLRHACSQQPHNNNNSYDVVR